MRAAPLHVLFLAARAFSAGPPFCGTCANGGPPPMQANAFTARCTDAAATISSIIFASYGTPTGVCPSFSRGTCDASNSSAVVSAACLGKSSCTVYPNTTTFGDPCYGTAKVLSAVFTCSSGAGVTSCDVPPAPPLANFSAAVSIDFGHSVASVLAQPSVQVVSQSRLWRDSPVHNQSFATLRALGVQMARFVPWIPYAAYGVAELMPPSGEFLCAPQSWKGGQSEPITLECGEGGGIISSVDFAGYGNPTGNCGAYVEGSCSAADALSIVEGLCKGQPSCVVPTAPGGVFGTPCNGANWLAVQARCSVARTQTYWNFTLLDQFLSDFWDAVDGNSSAPIINFSTEPSWLYDPNDYSWPANADAPNYGYDRGTADNVNHTALGEYYGRLYGYFIKNQMVDEAGVTHVRSGAPLDIRVIEVFNEVDYEHAYTPETYTLSFDAVVRGVRAAADPSKRIRFVGLNLPNIDDQDKVVAWATYFLNHSNHAADVVDGLNYVGYHAYPNNGGYSPDPSTFSRLFDYVDTFVQKVVAVDQVIAALSPDTLTVLDETGTDMDGVLGPGSPPNNNARYWVAAAGYFAYMFAKVTNASRTVVQVGASQLMDAPGQEPSVSLLDWSTGLGTARAWVVPMLAQALTPNSVFLETTSVSTGSDSPDALFAVGVATPDPVVKRALLINKRNAFVDVALACGSDVCVCSTVTVIDEFNGLNPARDVPCGADGTVTLAPYATAVLLFK